jgi:hypothetical protein
MVTEAHTFKCQCLSDTFFNALPNAAFYKQKAPSAAMTLL